MLCRVLEHYGLEVILVTMSRAGVLLVRRGDPAEPLPRKGALRSNNRRCQWKIYFEVIVFNKPFINVGTNGENFIHKFFCFI